MGLILVTPRLRLPKALAYANAIGNIRVTSRPIRGVFRVGRNRRPP